MTMIRHGLLVPSVCKIFEDLQVAASLYIIEPSDRLAASKFWVGDPWVQIHDMPNLLDFEVEHGLISERHVYNERCMRRVRAWSRRNALSPGFTATPRRIPIGGKPAGRPEPVLVRFT